MDAEASNKLFAAVNDIESAESLSQVTGLLRLVGQPSSRKAVA